MVTDSAEDNAIPAGDEALDDAAFFEEEAAEEYSTAAIDNASPTKITDPSSVIITANSNAAENATTWVLPSVGGKKVISAVRHESRRKNSHDSDIPQPSQDSISETDVDAAIEEKSADEVVGEDVLESELSETSIQPITAEQLAEMTEAAEREGFLKGQQQGYEKGYAEGKDQGYSEGQRLAEDERVQQQTEFADVKQRFITLAETLQAPIEEQDNKLELVMLKMIGDLTKKIVQRELQIDSSHILSVVQKSLEALPIGAKNITVILNPDDMALVETWAEERDYQWNFRADPEMSPGGCRVQTAHSLVDFSVEKRLQDVLQEFNTASDQLAAMEEETSVFEPGSISTSTEEKIESHVEPQSQHAPQEQLKEQSQGLQEQSSQEKPSQESEAAPDTIADNEVIEPDQPSDTQEPPNARESE